MHTRSERDLMLAGELYHAGDPELAAMRRRARRLCRLYNQTTEDESSSRSSLLTELFGSIGPGAEIEPPFHCDYGTFIRAGAKLFMNFGCVVLDVNHVTLGDNVLIGPYVQIVAATHPVDPALRRSGREYGHPVTIGNNVWIGAGAVICPGVTIGDDSVIGAGSVVVKDIPARSVAVGNPCRVIRTVDGPRE